MAWTSLKTWVTGDVLTSGELNTYLRDNLIHLAGSTGVIDASAVTKHVSQDAILWQALGL